ncbi:hypothetical protein IE53DRAFT_380021 [Violaceomyces palustris]|uniref:Uncharacterized protein n=1 Tax=Violaceomyces palustris TaxID=1673888 RepID=A0ACD0NW61_9BASI|nr:hypothetical protein IE53DRAFT_380021 [Violaceomyces palustris]
MRTRGSPIAYPFTRSPEKESIQRVSTSWSVLLNTGSGRSRQPNIPVFTRIVSWILKPHSVPQVVTRSLSIKQQQPDPSPFKPLPQPFLSGRNRVQPEQPPFAEGTGNTSSPSSSPVIRSSPSSNQGSLSFENFETKGLRSGPITSGLELTDVSQVWIKPNPAKELESSTSATNIKVLSAKVKPIRIPSEQSLKRQFLIDQGGPLRYIQTRFLLYSSSVRLAERRAKDLQSHYNLVKIRRDNNIAPSSNSAGKEVHYKEALIKTEGETEATRIFKGIRFHLECHKRLVQSTQNRVNSLEVAFTNSSSASATNIKEEEASVEPCGASSQKPRFKSFEKGISFVRGHLALYSGYVNRAENSAVVLEKFYKDPIGGSAYLLIREELSTEETKKAKAKMVEHLEMKKDAEKKKPAVVLGKRKAEEENGAKAGRALKKSQPEAMTAKPGSNWKALKKSLSTDAPNKAGGSRSSTHVTRGSRIVGAKLAIKEARTAAEKIVSSSTANEPGSRTGTSSPRSGTGSPAPTTLPWFAEDLSPEDLAMVKESTEARVARTLQWEGVADEELKRKIILGGLPEGASEAKKEPGNYLAIDCEMVGVGPNGSESLLARVSIVNYHGATIFDSFVKPVEKVTDYRTWVSGVRPRDLKNAPSFAKVQAEVASLIKGRVLVGHAIQNDLKALLLSHPRPLIRDTATFQPLRDLAKTKYPSLKKLSKLALGIEIQKEGHSHSSVEDARATMAIFRSVKSRWDESLRGKGGGSKFESVISAASQIWQTSRLGSSVSGTGEPSSSPNATNLKKNKKKSNPSNGGNGGGPSGEEEGDEVVVVKRTKEPAKADWWKEGM